MTELGGKSCSRHELRLSPRSRKGTGAKAKRSLKMARGKNKRPPSGADGRKGGAAKLFLPQKKTRQTSFSPTEFISSRKEEKLYSQTLLTPMWEQGKTRNVRVWRYDMWKVLIDPEARASFSEARVFIDWMAPDRDAGGVTERRGRSVLRRWVRAGELGLVSRKVRGKGSKGCLGWSNGEPRCAGGKEKRGLEGVKMSMAGDE